MTTTEPIKGRVLTIKGGFTDDELLDIIAVVQRIEQTRPNELFETLLDDPNMTREQFDKLVTAMPLPDDYFRVSEELTPGRGGPDRAELVARLERIYEKVDTADWQTRGQNPGRFLQFCSEIERIIDIDNLKGHP